MLQILKESMGASACPIRASRSYQHLCIQRAADQFDRFNTQCCCVETASLHSKSMALQEAKWRSRYHKRLTRQSRSLDQQVQGDR